MEKAWEFAAVSASLEILEIYKRMLRRPGFFSGLFGVLALQLGAMVFIGSEDGNSSGIIDWFLVTFTRPQFEGPNLIRWERIVSAVLIVVGILLFVNFFLKIVNRTASSFDERANDETAFEIRNLRREISKIQSEDFNIPKIESQIREIIEGQNSQVIFDLNDLSSESWSKVLLTGRERLLKETERLSARSRLNLTWGGVHFFSHCGLSDLFRLLWQVGSRKCRTIFLCSLLWPEA